LKQKVGYEEVNDEPEKRFAGSQSMEVDKQRGMLKGIKTSKTRAETRRKFDAVGGQDSSPRK
jgi:hypothetical protein